MRRARLRGLTLTKVTMNFPGNANRTEKPVVAQSPESSKEQQTPTAGTTGFLNYSLFCWVSSMNMRCKCTDNPRLGSSPLLLSASTLIALGLLVWTETILERRRKGRVMPCESITATVFTLQQHLAR